MFDSHKFYKQRLSAHIKETSRYLKYIFNGHIAVAMFFLVTAIAFYYQQWLAQLPDNFPVAWVIGIAFGLLVSYSPVRTLLQVPDLVFLVPAEQRMDAYFRNSLIYSFVIQLYQVALVVAALGPLYTHAYPERPGSLYLYTIVVVIIVKGWNLLANWWMLKVRDDRMRQIDIVIRFFLNSAIFYFLISGEMLFAGIITVMFILLFLNNYRISQKQDGLAWELLVDKDQGKMQAFYRIANMFTDVPHIRSPIKKRKWLTLFMGRVPFMKKSTYTFLYRLSFARSGDYLGMYVRLLIVGGLFIYFIPNSWMKLLFALLFLYLSSFQMITLYDHHRTIVWLDLYPVEQKIRQESLMKFLLQLTLVKTSIFSLIFLFSQDWFGFILALLGGVIFSFLFTNGYVKKRIVT